MNISKFDRTQLWERFTKHIDNNENYIFGNSVVRHKYKESIIYTVEICTHGKNTEVCVSGSAL